MTPRSDKVFLLCHFTSAVVLYSHLLALARGASRAGYDPSLFVNEECRTMARAGQYPHVYFGRSSTRSGYVRDLVAFLASAPRVVTLLRTLRPRVVLLYSSSPTNVPLLLLLRLARIKAHTMIYLHEPAGYRQKLDRGLGRMWALALGATQMIEWRLCNTCLVSSPRVAAIASAGLGIPPAKLHVAPLLAIDDSTAAPKLKRSVLFAGRTTSNRGIQEFLTVVKRNRESRGDMTFLLATRDSIEPLLKKFQLTPGHDFEFSVGRQLSDAEMAAFYRKAEVALLLYRTEIMQSGVPQMAYMHGCALLATDVAGVREDVVDDTTGRLIPADFDADLLANALDDIMPAAERLGRAGRKYYESHFSPDCFDRWYQPLLDRQ